MLSWCTSAPRHWRRVNVKLELTGNSPRIYLLIYEPDAWAAFKIMGRIRYKVSLLPLKWFRVGIRLIRLKLQEVYFLPSARSKNKIQDAGTFVLPHDCSRYPDKMQGAIILFCQGTSRGYKYVLVLPILTLIHVSPLVFAVTTTTLMRSQWLEGYQVYCHALTSHVDVFIHTGTVFTEMLYLCVIAYTCHV